MTEPRIVTIHEGAYLQCRAYAVLGSGGAVLIDPGSGYYDSEILSNLRTHGIAPQDVLAVLLTHYHVDHALGVRKWQERGARLLSSKSTAEGLRTASPSIWGEHPELVPAVEVDQVLADGQTVKIGGAGFDCVATPGHTAGCLSFVVTSKGARAAFTGDVLMPDSQPGWAGDAGFSQEALIESIGRLRTLGLARAFPGHGSIGGDVDKWLAKGEELWRSGLWRFHGQLTSFAVPDAS